MNYIENYEEIIKLSPLGFRDKLRNIALNGLSLLDIIRGMELELRKPRIQFLYIHHIFKDEEIKLDNLLKVLSKHHTFISYSDAVMLILERKIDKPYICISSDDGFKNNVEASKILNEYGAKGCFFVNPYIVGNSSFNTIENYCKSKLKLPPVEFMDWNDIEKLQSNGHEIGSHTMTHLNVAQTAREVFIDDCNSSYNILKTKCGEVKHFAFPYGRFSDFNEEGRKVVFNTGFISCATAERGCHINHNSTLLNDELCILRDHIILQWDIKHILHFIYNNSRKATFQNNLYPYNNL